MTSQRVLEGNGVGLVREIALASRIQRGLESLYRLDRAADVDAFVTHADEGQREALLVREDEDGLELQLRIPRLANASVDVDVDGAGLDPLCQIIEGVSHFVMLTQRASANEPVSQLELELQAEIDKYVVLGSSLPGLSEQTSESLRDRLYERVTFEHAVGSERGDRYRLANRMAARYTRSLERRYLRHARFVEMQGELRKFFHATREDKLRAAEAA